MSDIVHIDDLKPHYVVLAMCLACEKRWVGVIVVRTSLFKLECPRCGKQKSFASFMPDNYLEGFKEEFPDE